MSTRVKRLVFLLTGLAFLVAASLLLAPLEGMRRQYDLSSEPTKGLTPRLALATQLLGWGRGLIIDVIWIRMESLKEEGRFFELVQLADWACALAPRFPQVWDIQSWNLAYNVSCKVTHLPDRWAWVRAGIDLLRDQGIPLNPYSAMLYDRLAWIYFHKIGEQDDNAHFFYKQRFGLLMHEVLGGEGDEQTLKALINAPRTREELLQDQEAKRLSAECRDHGFDIVDRFFEWYKETPSVPAAVKEILKRPENAAALSKIEVYARARRLREEYKLDPERMLALTKQYGHFDWRSAYPHAIYWATVGLEKLDQLEKRTLGTFDEFGVPVPKPYDPETEPHREGEGLYEFRRVTLQRIVYASMQSLVQHGRLLFDTAGRLLLEAGTDYRFADATLPLFEKVIEAHGMRFKLGTQDGYTNFLSRGVLEFALANDLVKSYDYYRRLKEKFPREVGALGFEEYLNKLRSQFTVEMTTGEMRILVCSKLLLAFLSLACNADDKAAYYEGEAKAYVKEWNEGGRTKVEPNLRGSIRYRQLKEAVLTDILTRKVPFPDEALENLKNRLKETGEAELLQTILQNLEKGRKKLPEPEEVEPKWQQETYY